MAPFITNTNTIEAYNKANWQLPKCAKINQLIKTLLKSENSDALIKIVAAGNRILNSHISEEVAKIANGRNIKIYYGFKRNNKIKINYIKYQIKHLSKNEEEFIRKHWHIDFFELEGKKFIKKINGSMLENLLYNYQCSK